VIKRALFGHQPDVVGVRSALPAAPAAPAVPVKAAPTLCLAALFEAHFAFVWRSLRRLGLPEATADDAAQEVFIVAGRRLDAIEPGKEKAYLFGVALRVASDARRSARRRREDAVDDLTATSDPSPPLDELVDQRRARDLVDQLIAELPDDTRPVFILYELEGLTMAEIATALELPPGTVASRLRRGREEFTHRVNALQSPAARTP
jgi:RNA polymerase sigma-70 factor, ECF subfamily